LGGDFLSTYRDIVFEDFEVGDVDTLFEAHAPPQAPLRDVLVRNVAVASAQQTLILENVRDLGFDNVTVAGHPVSLPAAEPAEQPD
jgi:hypothetical protein